MRTIGSFIDIFNASREHLSENNRHLPINAVIRRHGDFWFLESSLSPCEECDLQIEYEAFLGFWYEGLKDPSYAPSESDIMNYLSSLPNPEYECE